MTDYLNNIKKIVGINDTDSDDVLNTVISLIVSRLVTKLDEPVVPEELEYIVIEASISRFNRINDEGKTTASQSDVSATYETDDLAPFVDDIANWLYAHGKTGNRGRFTFR